MPVASSCLPVQIENIFFETVWMVGPHLYGLTSDVRGRVRSGLGLKVGVKVRPSSLATKYWSLATAKSISHWTIDYSIRSCAPGEWLKFACRKWVRCILSLPTPLPPQPGGSRKQEQLRITDLPDPSRWGPNQPNGTSPVLMGRRWIVYTLNPDAPMVGRAVEAAVQYVEKSTRDNPHCTPPTKIGRLPMCLLASRPAGLPDWLLISKKVNSIYLLVKKWKKISVEAGFLHLV